MLKIVSRAASLCRAPIARSLPAFSTSSASFKSETPVDPTRVQEAPIIDNKQILEQPEDQLSRAESICVPSKVVIAPISGVPEEHVVTRRVRIYQPAKNAMQSGTNNINHWLMEFDNRQRWENPLMGWTSTGDPHSNLKVQFSTPAEAIEHCEKMGWQWFLDVPIKDKPFRPKSYGVNFSWNRRTRVSTK